MTVGIDTNYTNFGFENNNSVMNFQNPLNTKGLNNNSLFNFNGSGNSYDEDLLMPDSLKTSIFQNTTTPQTQNYSSVPTFQSNNVQQAVENPKMQQKTEISNRSADEKLTAEQLQSELMNRFDRSDINVAQTEQGNTYVKTNAYKKSGAVLGLLAPVAGKFVQLFKGGKFSELFKMKQIAIACPVVGLAGLAVGSLIDSYVNSQRAKAADEAKPEQMTPQQQSMAA